MSGELNFKKLGDLEKEVKTALASSKNIVVTGLPGCGRGSILNLIWSDYEQDGLLKILCTGVELSRFSRSLSSYLFTRVNFGGREISTGRHQDLSKLMVKARKILFLVQFFESLISDKTGQGFLASLQMSYRDKIQFVVSADLSVLTQPERYRWCTEIVFDHRVLINRLPDTLIRGIIKQNSGQMARGVEDEIADLASGNPDLAKYISLAVHKRGLLVKDEIVSDLAVKSRVEDIWRSLSGLALSRDGREWRARVAGEAIRIPELVSYYHRGDVGEGGVLMEFADRLSKSESTIYGRLKNDLGKCVPKEEIASLLWGDKGDEKYSEWAIYKVIQGLKRKMGKWKPGLLLKTIRGRGYILQTWPDYPV